MFGVQKYAQSLVKIAAEYNIKCSFNTNLIEINGSKAIFENLQTKEKIEKNFDFLHLVPPMSAHKYIADSGLADSAGYLEVDKYALRHVKHLNVWGLGDCTNTPNSKTAAAVFSQTETLVK
jgi:NADPH-dependent 2,4-dienoyl-CoA reductase/sulfur reductase-like enzyme